MENHALTRWDAMKILAVLLMFVDHAGFFYFTDEEWIRGIGRACAPIFLFLAAFAPHYRFDRTLMALAAALTVTDWLIGGPNTLNILWTIILIRQIFGTLEQRGHYKLRLHEWVIGALFMLPTISIVQYGSLGFMMALCGYAYKHRDHYASATPRILLWFVIVIYSVLTIWLSRFLPLTVLAMIPSMILMGLALEWFVRAPKQAVPCPPALVPVLRPLSRYTAIIYAVHLMILGWVLNTPL